MQLDNIDWNTVVPQITLAVAIISPVVVAIVNNAHNSKIRRLELKYEKQTSYFHNQQSIFDNYVLYASKQIEADYQSERTEYMRYYGELFMYVPESYWKELEKLNRYIQEKNKQASMQQLITVTKILGKILQESDLKFPKL